MSEFARNPEHVSFWLGPYLDDELTGATRLEVEQHLAACVECRAELDQLRALSTLLHEQPLPPRSIGMETFRRNVLSNIAAPRPPTWQRFLQVGWRFAPLFLFGMWAFVQAVSWIASGLLLGLRYVPAFSAEVPALAALTQSGGWLSPEIFNGEAQQFASELFRIGSIGMLPLISLVSGLLIGLLFLGWLASWLAYHRASLPQSE